MKFVKFHLHLTSLPFTLVLIGMPIQVVPVTFFDFATFLNAPCTALRLSRSKSDPLSSTLYLVVGKANGETIFFPTDRSEFVSKFENEAKVPISAIADGDLRNLGGSELVTVTASGKLTSLSFPSASPSGPICLFSQQLYPNICSAEVLDVDGDGLVELVVVMTDRVVRSYRFVEELSRLVPLNKWEMPTHISGWAIGLGCSNFALLSQSEERHYVRLEFGPAKGVRVLQSSANVQQTTKPILGSPSSAADVPPSPPPSPNLLPVSHLFIPRQPFAVHLLHSMAQRISLVDDESTQEYELTNPDGADIAKVCACATNGPSRLQIVITIDSWGQMNVYAWGDEDELSKAREPVVSCRVIRDADHICCFAKSERERDDGQLFVGVVNVFNRVAIFSINLGRIMISDKGRRTT